MARQRNYSTSQRSLAFFAARIFCLCPRFDLGLVNSTQRN